MAVLNIRLDSVRLLYMNEDQSDDGNGWGAASAAFVPEQESQLALLPKFHVPRPKGRPKKNREPNVFT